MLLDSNGMILLKAQEKDMTLEKMARSPFLRAVIIGYEI